MSEISLSLIDTINNQEILEEIKKNSFSLRKFEMTLERCLVAVRRNGLVLKIIPKVIQTEEVCLEAVKQNGFALRDVSKKILSSKIIWAAIRNQGLSLRDIPDKFVTIELCLEAVNQNGRALEYVPDIYTTIKVCELAVSNNGRSLKYVPKKNVSKNLCLKALNQDRLALEFIPNKFKTKKICEELIEKDWRTFMFVSEILYTKENFLKIFNKIIHEIPDFSEISSFDKNDIINIARNIPENIKSDKEIIKLERQLGTRYFKNKIFDKEKKKFIIEEFLGLNQEPEVKEFEDFKMFYNYLDGDLSNAYLYEYNFDNINLRDFNIDNAYISSSVLVAQNFYDESFYSNNIISKENKNEVRNSENNEVIDAASILHNTDFEQTVSNYSQKMYYISDIHLNHKLLKKFPRHATKQEIIMYIRQFIKKMVKTTSDSDLFGNNYLLIAGDVSFNFEVSKIFYEELIKLWDPIRIVVILGNHELWDYSLVGVKENTDVNLENIIQRYRDLFQVLKINFLHNELFILEEGQKVQIISEEQLLLIDENILKKSCLKSPFIIYGGLGFSGLNNYFNADNGIYRDTINTLTEDVKQTMKFENIYNQLEQTIGDNKQVIILSHTPKENWTNKKYNSNWTYVSGHTHLNEYHLDEDRTVYSDNQLGYHASNVGLKYFKVSKIYDIFKYYEDGKYIISKGQYLDFNYGMGIRLQFNKTDGNIHMLKNQGLYCFIYENTKLKKYYLLEGGRIHSLQHDSIDYYFERIPMYSKIVNETFANYNEFIKSISRDIQKIGGSGTIHGCIVDIDFFNHIYVNPYDGSVTPYYAASTVDKYNYRDIGDLLLAERKDLYKNYEKLLEDNNCIEVKQITDRNILSANTVNYIEDTLMYKPSKMMKSIQYLTEINIIRVWNENIVNVYIGIEN